MQTLRIADLTCSDELAFHEMRTIGGGTLARRLDDSASGLPSEDADEISSSPLMLNSTATVLKTIGAALSEAARKA